MAETPKRYAVVTGSNKGIGFEVCRQLAAQGITVVLTARDEKRGLEAVEKLKASSLSGSVIFHQLDVADSASVASLAEFIKSQFGKLDILVNNAGVSGVTVEGESLKASPGDASETGGSKSNLSEIKLTQTYDLAAECLQINYYGAKRTIEALLPLLQLSDSPRIINVSSSLGKLENIPDEWVKGVLSDAENLTEDKIDEVLNEFLKDFKEGSLEAKGWPKYNGAYILSKAALIAYTRILAKKYPSFQINSACPGYVNTDINFHTGHLTAEEGAERVVWVALLPDDGPSGCFFEKKEVSSFTSSMAKATKKYAVVTGANKGIGLEICRQLAREGITVVLTARDEKRGLEAVEKLKSSGLSDCVVFHQLDVADLASVVSLAEFVKSQFGKLDILVNNAGIGGAIVDGESFKASAGAASGTGGAKINWSEIMTQPYDLAAECLQINYYGAKRTTEALLPQLQLSDSPRIVNVSSSMGKLEYIPNEWAKEVLNDAENLTEERIDQVLNEFLKDFKEGSLEAKGWPGYLSAYILSKAAMNAYTRILAKKYPNFRINCVCPGYVKTDINFNTGYLTPEEGAESPVRLALLPDDGPSGEFFVRKEVSSFYCRYAVVTGANKGIGLEICRQLTSQGVSVVLTARNEKRGLDAVEKLKKSGLSDYIMFHQLDVMDSASIDSLAVFMKSQIGKLDILVNNAGVGGTTDGGTGGAKMKRTAYELAVECLQVNYYGTKRTTEALLPLLQLSDSPRIVNVSSSMGALSGIRNKWARDTLNDVENLTEESIDQVLNECLKDFKEGSVEAKGWPSYMSAYCISKAAVNAYTRLLSKKYPKMLINAVGPGWTKTDLSNHTGTLTPEEAARSPVRVALLPDDGPSGTFFERMQVSSF
ncbi:uncharacterized protein LOC105174340 [Sesamum indicum]|uniref:Uncharacterized protein LOC105174340 n=1 Tax=Sesamum indicum TaxID=4182 RepID=A0A8M8V2K9_SESIN|nr:uncharacterized protein LOC105174340 [Sesamum indicum]